MTSTKVLSLYHDVTKISCKEDKNRINENKDGIKYSTLSLIFTIIWNYDEEVWYIILSTLNLYRTRRQIEKIEYDNISFGDVYLYISFIYILYVISWKTTLFFRLIFNIPFIYPAVLQIIKRHLVVLQVY